MTRDPVDAAEHMAVIEEFLAVVRHDLRNRFCTIRSASFYLSRKAKASPLWDEDPRVPKFFSLISDELGLADEILTRGASLPERAERPRTASVDGLRSFVGHLGARFVGDDTLVIAADPDELRMALRCLVRNALERPEANDPPEVTVVRDAELVRVEVRDDGPRLDAGALARARVAFASTKPGHLGLGLSLVERFAARHRGSFELASDDEGTLARLVLPLVGGVP